MRQLSLCNFEVQRLEKRGAEHFMYFKFQAKVWEGIKQLKSFLLARSMSRAAHT